MPTKKLQSWALWEIQGIGIANVQTYGDNTKSNTTGSLEAPKVKPADLKAVQEALSEGHPVLFGYPPPTWDNYPTEAWFKASLAVIANSNGHGTVLYTAGPALRFEMEEGSGCTRLDDLGMDDAPNGISVWEGFLEYQPGTWECPEDGYNLLRGKYRDLTEAEWEAIKSKKCPWDDKEWRL
jgi:hypothetical protein